MRNLEHSSLSPGSPGSPGSRLSDATGRCSDPPSTRAGGQDDGSYTNSLKIRYAQCSEPTQRKPQRGAAEGRPPLWRRPKAASFVLALNIGHILVLRRKTCELLRAKTSALLRRKTCAALRARICAWFRANTKETTKGGGLRPPPFVEAAEGRLLCNGSEQSTCPSSQHSTCLSSQQGRCLGSQQGARLASQQ